MMSGMNAPDTVNSVVIVHSDNGATFQYDGPFSFLRDGGDFEVTLPTDPDDYAGIGETAAESIAENRVGEIVLAQTEDGIEASGTIAAADILEGKLTIRGDDPTFLDPSEVDRSGVDA